MFELCPDYGNQVATFCCIISTPAHTLAPSLFIGVGAVYAIVPA